MAKWRQFQAIISIAKGANCENCEVHQPSEYLSEVDECLAEMAMKPPAFYRSAGFELFRRRTF
jgi:hypothetical protein